MHIDDAHRGCTRTTRTDDARGDRSPAAWAGSPGSADAAPSSLSFARTARALGEAARLRGLVVPVFRSPPGLDVTRTIRRRRGVATISVRRRDRPWSAVIADMIEGIIVANGLSGARADRVRSALWLAVEGGRRPEAA